MNCVNCGGYLLPFKTEDDDGIEYYCPNNDCQYATVYDNRIMNAFNLRYQEDFNNAKDTWGQWGIEIKGKPTWKKENIQENIQVEETNSNQITTLQKDVKEVVDQPKFYDLKLDNIIGYVEIKDRLRDIINATKAIHFLMIGAPSVAKTVFLE